MEKVLTPTNYELIPLNDKTNVRFYTSVDPGSYVAPHWHDAIEIIYMQKGELKIFIENNQYELINNQCLIISPDRIHSTLCTKPNQAIVFQIPKSFFEKFVPNAKSMEFNLKDPADTLVQQGKVDIFKDTLSKMQFLVDYEPDGAVLRFNSLLFEVLFQLYHNFSTPVIPSDLTRQSKNLEKLEPILNYISENYNKPISLEEISNIAMFEPKYFCKFFKKCMGTTFLEYQNEIRLSKIYSDIISTNDKISDILERHGFTNYKLFRHLFRSHFDATPSEIRKDKNILSE